MRQDNRTPYRRPQDNKLKKLWAKPSRLSATATRETQFGEVDVPTIKLSTAFLVILFLHLALIAGVMIFRMLDRTEIADASAGGTTSAAARPPATTTPATPRATAPTTATPAAAPAPATAAPDTRVRVEPATPARETRRHVVRNRESLDGIAAQYGVTREAIIQANGLGNSKPFAQNMELIIPLPPREIRAERPGSAARDSDPEVRPARPVAGSTPAATVTTTTTTTTTASVAVPAASPREPAAAAGVRSHTVLPGETLWGISRKYNVTANALMQANGITDAAKLQSGAVLRIP